MKYGVFSSILEDMNDEPSTVSGDPKKEGSIMNKLSAFVKSISKRTYVVVSIAIVIFAFGALLTTQKTTVKETPGEEYTLVPEKVSESASIHVSLPEDISLANFDPAVSLHFSPEIKGKWQNDAAGSNAPVGAGNKTRTFRYLPDTKLALGAHYLATLDTPEVRLEKMFTVDKDPSVLAVFPKQEAEVNEYSRITIMFSRPMVALSTLSEMADMQVPVTITPATTGRWKWITTRTLQFIPATRLMRSSNYSITVNDGFRSEDGVVVAPFAHHFVTRSLAYRQDYYSGQVEEITHDEPLRIYFNQPIDLEKTRARVSLSSIVEKGLPIVLAYGTRDAYDDSSRKTNTLTDKSVLEIFPEKDSHGRRFLWDFDTSMTLIVNGAVPLEGDVSLNTTFNPSYHVNKVITSVSARSDRSTSVTPEYFDPAGTLVITTGEPVDLDASSIGGKGVAKVAYDEKCKEPAPGEEIEVSTKDCVKEPDHSTILITFDPTQFALGETSKVVIKKLVNTSGVIISDSNIEEVFTTYLKFVISSTIPADGAKAASLTEMVVCSSGAIPEPDEKEFYNKVKSNMMLGKWSWSGSYYISSITTTPGYIGCPVGTWETRIGYGLVPLYAYKLSLALDDAFGQHAAKDIAFTSEDADPMAKGFTHLQDQVLMTPPDRTKLSYGLDFMDNVDMTICKVSGETMLNYRVNMPDISDSADTLACIDTKEKHIVLPSSYATRKYFQIDLHDYYSDPTGNYVVVFSNPGYRRATYNGTGKNGRPLYIFGSQLYEKTFLSVTRLAVGAKQAERNDYNYGYSDEEDVTVKGSFMNGKWPANLYWVNDAHTLAPITGAMVTAYASKNSGNKLTLIALPSKQTDAQGIATMPSADNIAGAIIQLKDADGKATESAVISMNTDSLSYASGVSAVKREFIYTDRPIYRPGDTVHVKGIARIGYDAKYEPVDGTTTITIRDASYNVLRTQDVAMTKNGTYESNVILDSKAPLGYYQISTDGGYGSFQVEEYVAPQFKVGVEGNKEEYVSGDTGTWTVSADYYFGVPVSGGTVEYRIVSQDYYFDRYTDEYFNFGRGWYEREDGWYGDHYIAGGKATVGKDGKAIISKELNIDKLFTGDNKNTSKLVTLRVTVKNENGQSVSSEHSFIVHRGSFYAGLAMDDYFYNKGQAGTLKVKTVDIKGVPIAKSGLSLELDRIDWKSYKRQEVDGNFYYRSEKTLTKIDSTNLSTDDHGNGSYAFTAGEAGEYQFTLTGKDEQGNPITATYGMYVSGEGNVEIKPTNNATLELVSDKTALKVGDTAHFVIKSPYPKAKALVTIVRGDIYERKVVDLTSEISEYSFPVTEQYIPSVEAQVLLLSPLPEVKYGAIDFSVDTKEKELNIAVTPNKKVYLPGEGVTLDVRMTDSKGAPVVGETSLSVVDMSVLALVGNPKKNPIAFFYGYTPVVVRTLSNVKNVLTVAEIPTGTKGGSGGGGDDLEKKERGVFRDTAFWEGTVVTDKEGHATIHFTLPDNLTEWQVESVGITKDTKVGAGYTDFTSRKTLMAVPLKPRFVIPGDTLSIGGTVFNESDERQSITVSVTSPSLSFTGNVSQSITLDPHASLSVSFPALAPESKADGVHTFTLSAKNAEYEDVVDGSFPIERNETYESTVTAGRVTDASWKERLYLPKNVVPDRGGLTISLSATMASLMNDAITNMIIYPYECSEQVGGKLRTIALVKENDALFGTTTPILSERYYQGGKSYTVDEIVALGLAKLYQSEGADGGVSFYAYTPEDFWLTRSTLETYLELRAAGYDVDQSKIDAAARFVYNSVTYPRQGYAPSPDDTIASAYVLSLMKDKSLSNSLASKVAGYADDKDLVANRLSTPALAYLAILATKQHMGYFATNRVFAEFENRSSIDARGTIVKNGNSSGYSYFSDEVANTALALKAFSESERESPLLEGYLRSIKKTRVKDGGWASTYSSITVIDAVTKYLSWKKEGSAHEAITASVGGSEVLAPIFDKNNVTETFATTVPMTALAKGRSESILLAKKDLGTQNDAYYYDMSLKYYLPANMIPARDEGFTVERGLYRLDDTKFEHPVTSAMQGEVLHGHVILKTGVTRSHVGIEDFIPAGVEIVNQNFATEDQTLGRTDDQRNADGTLGMAVPMQNTKKTSWASRELASIFSFGNGGAGPVTDVKGEVSDEAYAGRESYIQQLYPTMIENHDDRIFAYVGQLGPGEYVFDYYVRALVPGTYQHLPMIVSELYTPENFGRTQGELFTVTKKSE